MFNDHQNDNDSVESGFEAGRPILVQTDDLVTRCAVDLGIGKLEAESVIEWSEENLAGAGRGGQLDEETLRLYREMKVIFARAFSTLIEYQRRQSSPQFLRMSTRAMALVLGFADEAGASTPRQLAAELKLDRAFGGSGSATVHKCCKLFLEEKLKLPPLPTQRTETTRKHMSESRKKQLTQ